MPEKTLQTRNVKKLNVVGLRCAHYFKHPGTQDVVKVFCSDEEYDALALPNPINPTHGGGYVWVKSAREVLLDSADGDFEPDSYIELGEKAVIHLAENKKGEAIETEKTEIIDSKVDVWL